MTENDRKIKDSGKTTAIRKGRNLTDKIAQFYKKSGEKIRKTFDFLFDLW